MGECSDVKALRTDLLRSAFWPRSRKSGVIHSLSLVTVTLDSAQPSCLSLDLYATTVTSYLVSFS